MREISRQAVKSTQRQLIKPANRIVSRSMSTYACLGSIHSSGSNDGRVGGIVLGGSDTVPSLSLGNTQALARSPNL